MRHLATTFFAVVAIVSVARGSALREQLALAEEASDKHAQIELIRRLLDQGSDGDLNRRLVKLWLAVSDYDRAETALQAWKNAPENFQVSVLAEVLYRRNEEKEKAAALLVNYHAKEPADLEITAQLAGFYVDQREQPKLVELLSEARGVAGDAGLLLMRAKARRSLADFEGALRDFSLVDQVDSKVADGSRPSYERLQAALPNIKAATALLNEKPEDFGALVTRANWLQFIEAGDLSRPDAKAAFAVARESTAAKILLARSAYVPSKALEELSVDLSKSGPPPESLAKLIKYDQLLAANPRDVDALIARSSELAEAAQFRLSLQDAESALEINRASPGAHLEKIFALLRLSRPSEAAAALLIMEGTRPPAGNLARAYGYLADAEFSTSHFDQALEHASKALKFSASEQLYKSRAAILQRMGRAAEARDDLESAMALSRKP